MFILICISSLAVMLTVINIILSVQGRCVDVKYGICYLILLVILACYIGYHFEPNSYMFDLKRYFDEIDSFRQGGWRWLFHMMSNDEEPFRFLIEYIVGLLSYNNRFLSVFSCFVGYSIASLCTVISVKCMKMHSGTRILFYTGSFMLSIFAIMGCIYFEDAINTWRGVISYEMCGLACILYYILRKKKLAFILFITASLLHTSSFVFFAIFIGYCSFPWIRKFAWLALTWQFLKYSIGSILMTNSNLYISRVGEMLIINASKVPRSMVYWISTLIILIWLIFVIKGVSDCVEYENGLHRYLELMNIYVLFAIGGIGNIVCVRFFFLFATLIPILVFAVTKYCNGYKRVIYFSWLFGGNLILIVYEQLLFIARIEASGAYWTFM